MKPNKPLSRNNFSNHFSTNFGGIAASRDTGSASVLASSSFSYNFEEEKLLQRITDFGFKDKISRKGVGDWKRGYSEYNRFGSKGDFRVRGKYFSLRQHEEKNINKVIYIYIFFSTIHFSVYV